jgi:hypothetical protein
MSEEEKTSPEAKTEVPAEETETKEIPVVEPDAESEVPLAEAESKTGIKEGAQNEDAIAAEGGEEAPEEAALPSFFVEEEDRLTVEVDILFSKETGNLVSVSRAGFMDKAEFEALGFTQEKFHFKPVGYEQMSQYRQRCSVYRRDAGRALVDPVALRNYFIVWHLKDWTMRDRKGEMIELKFNENGALDDDSIQQVYKINTTMLDVVLTLFEKDMMM